MKLCFALYRSDYCLGGNYSPYHTIPPSGPDNPDLTVRDRRKGSCTIPLENGEVHSPLGNIKGPNVKRGVYRTALVMFLSHMDLSSVHVGTDFVTSLLVLSVSV